MQDWLEFDWEAESYEEDSDVQQEHKHIQFPATVPEHIAEKAEDEEGAAQQIDFGESQERVSPAACPFEQFDSPTEPLRSCTRQTLSGCAALPHSGSCVLKQRLWGCWTQL